jgi:peptide deformylase
VPTLRRIATIGHPILRTAARPLTQEELAAPAMQGFIDDLIATMRDAAGAGIAATQVYEPVRICVIEVKDNPRYPYKPNIPLTVLVNPVVTPLTDEVFANYEGCLSVPNLRGVVDRFTQVRVTGWNRQGAPIDQIVRGLSAGTYQHEVDHLDGKLFVDRVKDPTTLTTWQDFERFHQAPFMDRVHDLVARYGS